MHHLCRCLALGGFFRTYNVNIKVTAGSALFYSLEMYTFILVKFHGNSIYHRHRNSGTLCLSPALDKKIPLRRLIPEQDWFQHQNGSYIVRKFFRSGTGLTNYRKVIHFGILINSILPCQYPRPCPCLCPCPCPRPRPHPRPHHVHVRIHVHVYVHERSRAWNCTWT
jgi:hypothetical protein